MAGQPASTLLHLGPGLGNGLANLHNAHRALSPVVNIVGEHAHVPPASTIRRCTPTSRRSRARVLVVGEGASSRPPTPPLRPPTRSRQRCAAGTNQHADPSGRHRMERIDRAPAAPRAVAPRARVDDERVLAQRRSLRKGNAALILNGPLLRTGPLDTCGRIAAATGAELLAPTQVPRLERGAGRVFVDRIPYVIESRAEAAAAPEARRAGQRARAGRVLRLSRQAESPPSARLRGDDARRPCRRRHRRRRAARCRARRQPLRRRRASRSIVRRCPPER